MDSIPNLATGWGGMENPTNVGQNQFMSFPALPNFNPPGMSQKTPTQQFTFPYPATGAPSASAPSGTAVGGSPYVGHGYYEAPTYDPAFTSNFYAFLQQLLQGGGADLQANLLSFLTGGPSSIPGASQLGEMATTGDPISALPEWQAMLEAQKRNIAQGEANLKEQFGFAGDLKSSPFGTAMSDYMQQTTLGQNALLAQLQTAALENAMQRKLTAGQDISQMAGAESQFLNELFSTGAFASPALFAKGQSSVLGGIGEIGKAIAAIIAAIPK